MLGRRQLRRARLLLGGRRQLRRALLLLAGRGLLVGLGERREDVCSLEDPQDGGRSFCALPRFLFVGFFRASSWPAWLDLGGLFGVADVKWERFLGAGEVESERRWGVAGVESEEGLWGVAGSKGLWGSADSVIDRTYDLGLDKEDEERNRLFVHAVTNAPAEDISMHGLQTPMNLQSWMGTNSVLIILPSIVVFQKSPAKPCAKPGFSEHNAHNIDTNSGPGVRTLAASTPTALMTLWQFLVNMCFTWRLWTKFISRHVWQRANGLPTGGSTRL